LFARRKVLGVANLDGMKFTASVLLECKEDVGCAHSASNSCFDNDIRCKGADRSILDEDFLGVEIRTFNFGLVKIGLYLT
jgi:hypothetical protein